jgi:hypothetical protein
MAWCFVKHKDNFTFTFLCALVTGREVLWVSAGKAPRILNLGMDGSAQLHPLVTLLSGIDPFLPYPSE